MAIRRRVTPLPFVFPPLRFFYLSKQPTRVLSHFHAPGRLRALFKSHNPPHPPRGRHDVTTFKVNLDKLAPSVPFPLTLRLRLTIPPVNEIRAPASLHGFFGNVRFANIWSAQAKVDSGDVVAELPESSLTRARWLDPTVQTTITQQIVDGATLLFLVYELDRSIGEMPLPSMKLVTFQRYVLNAEDNVESKLYDCPASLLIRTKNHQTVNAEFKKRLHSVAFDTDDEEEIGPLTTIATEAES
ncbi:hypothetical protein B0H19DRAFT_1251187 [Mycena capillaripes]|nr:hypothetical protein B0H19DRAFT_1251187 [Mycena capillaripes]